MKLTKAQRIAFESAVAVCIIHELRTAMKAGVQLALIIDPWALGGGTTVFASHDARGRSYEIDATETSARRVKKRGK